MTAETDILEWHTYRFNIAYEHVIFVGEITFPPEVEVTRNIVLQGAMAIVQMNAATRGIFFDEFNCSILFTPIYAHA